MSMSRVSVMLCCILASVLFVTNLKLEPTAAAECTDSLQAKIDAAPSGDIVNAAPCIYRQQISITKPLTLVGQPGSEIRGSDVWTGWSYSGGYWSSSKTLPLFPQEQVSCELGTFRCSWPEQVFIDGRPLVQVASSPGTGQFTVNPERKIILKDDPSGHTIEVTVRRHWITGSQRADNVIIEGFTMKHAANEWRSGGIINREPTTRNPNGSYSWSRLKSPGSTWTVRDNVLTDAHGAVVSLINGDPGGGVGSKDATSHKIINNEIARGGQLGVHNIGDGGIVRNNFIHHNNTEYFCYVSRDCTLVSTNGQISQQEGLKEAGGMKLAGGLQHLTIDGNVVSHNRGNGVWLDEDTFDVAISNNRIHHNTRRGIHFEISAGGKIFGNVLWENGWGTPIHVDGAGIGISNSSNVEVYSNTLAWNADGIAVLSLDRDGTDHDQVTDVFVHDNSTLQEDARTTNDRKTLALGWIQGWSTQMFDPASNNRGVNNKYWYAIPESSLVRYEWRQTSYSKLTSFNATSGEEGGRYLTLSEKDTLVANTGIPANPEPR
jgi:parallel beta-helix repeat protein